MSHSELHYHYSLLPESPTTPRRRLPTLPSRPQSRPLPPIPRQLSCKECKSSITCISMLLPLSKIPPRSRAFRGFNGKASLFTEIHHVNLSRPVVHLMNTGAHTMEEISCSTCHSYLGWHIIRAHSSSERWKEGHFLMELENLSVKMDKPRRQRSVMSSDSEDSNLE